MDLGEQKLLTRLMDMQERLGACERARDDERKVLAELGSELGDIRSRVDSLNLEFHTRLLQMKSELAKRVFPETDNSSKMQKETCSIDLVNNLDLVRGEVAEMRHEFEMKLQELQNCQEGALGRQRSPQIMSSAAEKKEEKVRRLNSTESVHDYANFGHHVQKLCVKKLDASTWSLPLFVFLEPIASRKRFLDNLLAVWCILLNIAVQVLFVIIVALKFSKTPPAIEGAETWRRNLGHWRKYADSRGTPMVHRLCTEDLSLEVSTGQVWMYREASNYVSLLGDLHVGAALGCLCLFVWVVSQMRDVLSACQDMGNIWSVPTTRSTVIHTTEDGFSLKSIGSLRLATVLLTSIIRLGLCIVLSYSGTVWLSSTRNIEEMLLNAVALQFILEIDETIYECMLPSYIKIGTDNLEPLHAPSASQAIGIPVRATAATVSALAYVIIFWRLEVDKMRQDAQAVKDALCDGPKNFVVESQSSTGIVLGFVKHGNWVQGAESHMHRVTQKMIDGTGEGSILRLDSWEDFTTVSTISLDAFVARFGECRNFDEDKDYILEPLREELADENLTSCTEMSTQMCSAGPIVRFACPETCGCTTPMKGNYVLDGCPMRQCRLFEAFLSEWARLPTEDIHPYVLSSLPEWREYWSSYAAAKISDGSNVTRILGFNESEIRRSFLDTGCGAYQQIIGAARSSSDVFDYFCDDTMQPLSRRPISIFCPETCSCGGRPGTSLFCRNRFTSTTAAECNRIDVWGMSMTGCHGVLPARSNPYAIFTCTANGYNGKNRYDYADRAGRSWTIRWESDKNKDFGAIFVAGSNKANGSSKWTLTSRRTGSIDQRSVHSFAINNVMSQEPPEGGEAVCREDSSRLTCIPPEGGWQSPGLSGEHCSAVPLQVREFTPRLHLTAIISLDQESQHRGIELYATKYVRKLSNYALGISKTGGVNQIKFNFPAGTAPVPEGSYIYLSWGGFGNFENITGKRALYHNQDWLSLEDNHGLVVFFQGAAYDRYGDEEADGFGQNCEHTSFDVLYRVSNALPATKFSMNDWFVADNVSILGSYKPPFYMRHE